MRFLDVLHLGAWHAKGEVREAGQLAAGPTREHDRAQAELASDGHRFAHVARVAARADADKNVARTTVGLHQACEDAVEAIVVATGSEERCVGRQSDRRQTWARKILPQHTREFGGDMLAVARAAAIAAQQELAARREAAGHPVDGLLDPGGAGINRGLFHTGAFGKMGGNKRLNGGGLHREIKKGAPCRGVRARHHVRG